MSDNSANPSTDKLVSQAAPVVSTHPPSPVVTPSVVAPDVDATAPDTTDRMATNVTPPVQESPQRDTVIDPRVVALRAMFPDYDDLILCVRSSRCPPIDLLLIHIAIAGYLYLNL